MRVVPLTSILSRKGRGCRSRIRVDILSPQVEELFEHALKLGLGMAELIVEGEARVVDLAPLRYSRFAEGDLLSSRYKYKVLA